MRRSTIIILTLLVYYSGAMLTGTYWYQHKRNPAMVAEEASAFFLGAIWPIYWSGRAAAYITK